jgi:hypothetical protein
MSWVDHASDQHQAALATLLGLGTSASPERSGPLIPCGGSPSGAGRMTRTAVALVMAAAVAAAACAVYRARRRRGDKASGHS